MFSLYLILKKSKLINKKSSETTLKAWFCLKNNKCGISENLFWQKNSNASGSLNKISIINIQFPNSLRILLIKSQIFPFRFLFFDFVLPEGENGCPTQL